MSLIAWSDPQEICILYNMVITSEVQYEHMLYLKQVIDRTAESAHNI